MLQVEKCGRLVEQCDFRLLRKRAGEEDTLALAAGQFLNVTAQRDEEIEALERGGCNRQIGRALEAECAEMRRAAHQHDLEHGEAERDRIFLADRGDRAREFAAIDRIERAAKELDAASLRLIDPPSTLSSVDLPAPLGPTIASISPAATSIETPCRTGTPG